MVKKIYRDRILPARVWTVAELKKLPVGTIFHHSYLGPCWIAATASNKKYMMFAARSGYSSATFDVYDSMWRYPMQLIFCEKKK